VIYKRVKILKNVVVANFKDYQPRHSPAEAELTHEIRENDRR
jgi:hypothetical protein